MFKCNKCIEFVKRKKNLFLGIIIKLRIQKRIMAETASHFKHLNMKPSKVPNRLLYDSREREYF